MTEEKTCRGVQGKPCITTKKPQPLTHFAGRSAVCRQCRNKKKREANRQKKAEKIDRRQPKPKFITFMDLVMTRLWTDPELRDIVKELQKSPN